METQASGSKEFSSLPLILATTGAVLACALIGWFMLDTDQPDASLTVTEETTTAQASPAGEAPDSNVLVVGSAELANVSPDNPQDLAGGVQEAESVDIDSELRKARLAADADMLVAPAEQNALYFYGRVLNAQPDHAVARSELDAVLAQVALQVSDHLASGSFGEANALAELVAPVSPEHPLVLRTRSTIAERADRLVNAAQQSASAGNDAAAETSLADVELLPGIGGNYLVAARAAVEEARNVRIQNEQAQLESDRIAAEQANAEWADRIRGAIKAGRLVAPAGDNANELLAEYDAPLESKSKLGDELVDALLAAGRESTSSGNIADAEAYLSAASGLRADADGLADLQTQLEEQIIQVEEAKILGLGDFVRINTEPARYPRLAAQLNATGWVDVLFTVTETGQTNNIEVIQAEPDTIFNRAAVEAVERWTFQPREFRGRMLNQRASARLVFQLQ